MEMATVNLKGGTTTQVPLEEVEDYMLNNSEKLEYKSHKVRRPMLSSESEVAVTS
jgi:hypothetical protein